MILEQVGRENNNERQTKERKKNKGKTEYH